MYGVEQAYGKDEVKAFETAYVVKFHNFKQLAKSKPCFKFVHPNTDSPIDNKRYAPMNRIGPERLNV